MQVSSLGLKNTDRNQVFVHLDGSIENFLEPNSTWVLRVRRNIDRNGLGHVDSLGKLKLLGVRN